MSKQTNQPAPLDRHSLDVPNVDGPSLDLDEARALGRYAGMYFDLRLRRDESRQRERRLSEAAWFGTDRRGGGVAADSYELAKLRSQVKDLGDYQQAIENSIAWRAIQWLRGLFGRAW